MQATTETCSPQALRWLHDLVQYQTVSGSESNLALLEQVEAFLSARGFEVRYTHSADGKRANLYARLGPSKEGGIMLSGHTDVVPVSGQNWSRAPFAVTEEVDRLYGRGVCDMKGYLAAVLAVVERIDTRTLSLPLHVAFTYDEEIGCLGVRGLLRDLANEGIRPAACIVGEPTSMKVVRAHKGRHSWRCTVQGQAAHSSTAGLGVNAAEVAARLVAEISGQALHLQTSNRDEGFYVPYSTMATCRIHSGTATNVIPEEAEFDFDLRYLPGVEPEMVLNPIHLRARALQDEMQSRVQSSRIKLERRTEVPALVPENSTDDIVTRIVKAGGNLGGHVAYTTEGGLYQAQGIPTVVCGPGDIAQAHTADEFILKSEIGACEAVLARLLSN